MLRLMGEKEQRAARDGRRRRAGRARQRRASLPMPNAAAAEAERIGYPLIIKASAGGGGRGMRVVRTRDELVPAWETARNEAQQAFGVPDVYLEKFIERPRHIEFQVLGDQHGNLIHLGRARVQHSAPPSEAGRGIAFAGSHSEAARRNWAGR